jgi:hypothetical protein
VAIVQVSRITQRKGLLADLPSPLAGAELGWATDERRLFIGNGTLEDGAPVVGNTEVLTEFSDILSFSTTYTYEGEAAGYTVQTGASVSTPVSQSLQRRLDSNAVITDFGATGDGITDVTAMINRALYQIYCREANPQVRRSIFFPAGLYIITDTLDIPPYACLYGEGAESTIISFNVQPHNGGVVYSTGVLVSSGGNYYRSLGTVPIGVLVTNTSYWTPETLPPYIARTADSLQQTGVNIATNGATAPQNIEISGMAFVTNQLNDGFMVQNAETCFFNEVSIEGPLTQSNIIASPTGAGTRAIAWASTTSLVCTQVNWNNCRFRGFTWGTESDQALRSCTIANSHFSNLYQGAYFEPGTSAGASGLRVIQNLFDSIYAEGVEFDNVSLNMTGYNLFRDVGNEFNGVTVPSAPIIKFNGDNNVSVSDMFERDNDQSQTYPRIDFGNSLSMSLSMSSQGIEYNDTASLNVAAAGELRLGGYRRGVGVTDTLTNNSSATLARITSAEIPAFTLRYTIVRDSTIRTGEITVVSGTTFSFNDDYAENASTGVTLSAAESLGIVTISYSTTNTGVNGAITYSIQHLI